MSDVGLLWRGFWDILYKIYAKRRTYVGETIHSYLICALLSMAPISELRGAIVTGIGLGLSPVLLYFICVVCNMLPIPFIILFIRKILHLMKSWGGIFERVASWIEKKAHKNMDIYYKYAVFGLYIFVAIPLPGTGAWTGALIAAFLDLRLKNAIPAIAAGVATAGIIMLVLSLGVKGIIS